MATYQLPLFFLQFLQPQTTSLIITFLQIFCPSAHVSLDVQVFHSILHPHTHHPCEETPLSVLVNLRAAVIFVHRCRGDHVQATLYAAFLFGR